MEKQLQEKLQKAKDKIVANSKDAHFAKSLIDELVSLQKQADVEPTEVYIPVAEVVKSHDFGPVKLSKVAGGKFLFEAKGGMWTVVSMRMRSLYGMCEHIFRYLDDPEAVLGEVMAGAKEAGVPLTEDDLRQHEEMLREAAMHLFQAPIYFSMDDAALFDMTAKMLQTLNEHYGKALDAELRPETDEDAKANIEHEDAEKAAGEIASAPIPDID